MAYIGNQIALGVASSGTGATTSLVTLNTNATTTGVIIASGYNGVSVGPLTIAAGATLTLAAGQRHVII
mgnify:CR=1 FL=1